MYKRILFPTDFGEYARQTLQCVLEFRHVGLEEIVLVHVIDVEELRMYSLLEALQDREAQLRELALIQLAELETYVKEHGVRVSSHILRGIPSYEIVRMATEERFSLIIGGSHRVRSQQEDPLDTTTLRVVRASQVPVLVARPSAAWQDPDVCAAHCRELFSTIVMPVDWSDCAMRAVDYLAALRLSTRQKIILTHVMDERSLEHVEAATIEEFRQNDLRRLEHTRTRLALLGFDVTIHLHVGVPHREIPRVAREEQATLIVMGHHGKGWLKNLMVGSTTERVLRSTTLPVLVVGMLEHSVVQ